MGTEQYIAGEIDGYLYVSRTALIDVEGLLERLQEGDLVRRLVLISQELRSVQMQLRAQYRGK